MHYGSRSSRFSPHDAASSSRAPSVARGDPRPGRPLRAEPEDQAHVLAFVTAYNFAKHLKALRWRTPFQSVCEAWAKAPDPFKVNPYHLIPGPHTSAKRFSCLHHITAVTLQRDVLD